MTKFTFEAEYAPGQKVNLVALERPAMVEMVRVSECRYVDYFVTWWEEGKHCSEWLAAREIAA